MEFFQSIWQRISAHRRRQKAQQLRTTRQQPRITTHRSDSTKQQLAATITNQAEITEQQLETKKLARLEQLPVELLLSISDFLFSEDILCLALCSSRIFVALGRQTGNIKLPQGRGKLPFLRRLERDLPSYFICYCCMLLHKYDGLECYKPTNLGFDSDHALSCVRNRKWITQGLRVMIHGDACHSYYDLYFFHVQLAMRCFFGGPKSGLTPEALAYTQGKECGDADTLASIETRICSVDEKGSGPCVLEHPSPPSSSEVPSLCLRVQDMVMVRRDEVYLIDPASRGHINFGFLWICKHVLYSDILNSIKDLIKAHSKNELKPTCSAPLNRCRICSTDYRYELLEFSSHDLALVITRWVNLGTGSSPDDPQWKRVQSPFTSSRPLDAKELPSPRLAFEKVVSGHWPEEALTSSNISLLRNSEYQNSMEQSDYDSDIWISPTPRKASIGPYTEQKD